MNENPGFWDDDREGMIASGSVWSTDQELDQIATEPPELTEEPQSNQEQ